MTHFLRSSLFLLLFAVQAYSADACPQLQPCPQPMTCLCWTASTTWTDGTPITVPVTYNVHRGDTTPVLIASTQELKISLPHEPAGWTCYRLTATAKDSKGVALTSIFTNPACTMVKLAAPTDGAIESPTDGAIER